MNHVCILLFCKRFAILSNIFRSIQGLTIGKHCVHLYAYFYWWTRELDMHTLTLMLIFSYDLLKFQNCSIFYNFILFKKTYCYVFDLWFNCLSMELLDFLVFTFVLKKPYFSIYHTYYLINITLNRSGYIGKDWKPFAKQ